MRLDINYRKKSVKYKNTWRLHNTLLINQEITEEIKEEIKKYVETNDNESTTTQNLWDSAKAVLGGKRKEGIQLADDSERTAEASLPSLLCRSTS